MCTGVGNFVRVPSRTYDLSARHGSVYRGSKKSRDLAISSFVVVFREAAVY